jgi:transposase InsO family protein
MGNGFGLFNEEQAMPWGPKSMVDVRAEFVLLARAETANVRELCRRFGISPKTAYKWLGRYEGQGLAGLADRPRRPKCSPKQSSQEMEAQVLEQRKAHPAWGGRKIAAAMRRKEIKAPSPSTVTAILRRNGVELGAFGGGVAPFIRFEHPAPNDLWQMDFKGHVAMREGRLHPLTVLDDHSRYAIVTSACANEQTDTVKTRLITAFRRYGLPLCIMTDNGSPWGDGPGSPFTPLGVFLIEQGIRIGHSRPYHPQTNGKDERYHRSLKAEALSGPPFDDLAQAEAALVKWRHVYNTERPHEALGLGVPIDRYRPSPRPYRDHIEAFDYAPDDIVRRVQQQGIISFRGTEYRIPKAFYGKDIAFRPTETDRTYKIYFRHQFIKSLDIQTK